MKLDKAIEITSSNGLCPEGTTWDDYLKAVKLGFHALKRLKRARIAGKLWAEKLLPGETQ